MAYCCLVERYIQLAGRALQFADFDLPTVGGFAPSRREIKRAAHRAAKSVSDAVETLTDAMGM